MTWNELSSKQIQGKSFQTWSMTGKARKIDFMVDLFDDDGITFRKQNGKLQRVSKTAAECVVENWDRYKAGEVTRAELAVSNFSTSYLFGVLHALEAAILPQERPNGGP